MMPLTKEQAAFIGCYTGICFSSFRDIHEFAERTLGRPILTHEFADEKLWEQLQDKLRPMIEEIAYAEKSEWDVPLYTHPSPAVVRQLVDGLAGLIDFIEIDNLKIDQDALRIAKAALATAKEAGL